jgi:ATP-dependent helicase/nuclease subunit A
MKQSQFTIYQSSAGSGKTRTLAKEYLKIALAGDTYAFKKILAITFTNKATQEMKDRILSYLRTYAQGEKDSLSAELEKELKITGVILKDRSSKVLSAILHEYSYFSICTIDAFFQKVIRAFTKEVGIGGGYKLELDQALVMEQVVDAVVEDVGVNEQLTKWVIEYSKDNLKFDRAWDVRHALRGFAEEILREDFRLIEDKVESLIKDPSYFPLIQEALTQTKASFLTDIVSKAKQALSFIDSKGWKADDFKYSGGPFNFLQKVADATNPRDLSNKDLGSRPRKEYLEAKNWADKNAIDAFAIEHAADTVLIPWVREILTLRDNGYELALSAELLLSQFYSFGLIADVARKLGQYKTERNVLLLSDASRLLSAIIGNSDTPFIYEKIGSYYDYFLIDEFQDTSLLQWKNLKPLLLESLDKGKTGMIVGDVKQSIYRWRGGDLTLLQDQVRQDLGPERVQVQELKSNYRSAKNIVEFNNTLFDSLATDFAGKVNNQLLKDAYATVSQETSSKLKGEVQIEFVGPEENLNWKDTAMQRMLDQIQYLRLHGAALQDIAVLVRKNSEGQDIAKKLTEQNIAVVSNESLLLTSSPSVRVLAGILKWLSKPADTIAASEVLHDYMQLQEKEVNYIALLDGTPEAYLKLFPLPFQEKFKQLPFYSLFEITESLISTFELGKPGEIPFIESFQSLVLDFMGKERNDVAGFVEYWESISDKRSIQMPENVEAVQVMSIHLSKGLQFKYVLIPFCHWELDHPAMFGPMLWVESVESMGYMPIRYSSVMKDSLFNDQYEEEQRRTLLDNLNLLYVAFTRAELGLYVYAPQAAHATRSQQSISKSILESLTLHPNLSAKLQDTKFSFGTFTKVKGKPKHKDESVDHSTYITGSWREKLAIKPHERRQPVVAADQVEVEES